MDAVADRLSKFEQEDGYGGIAYDIDSRSINFWWKGELDPAVRAIIDNVRGDVTVNVHAANFSRAELGAASMKIDRTRAPDGSYVVQAVNLEDLDRPTFVYGLSVIAELGPGADKDAVEAALTRKAGVPVVLSNMAMPSY